MMRMTLGCAIASDDDSASAVMEMIARFLDKK